MICPRCGLVLPYTGAFEFVVCPRCRAAVWIAHAAPAPPPGFPSAADTDRPSPPTERFVPTYPLPGAAAIRAEIAQAEPPAHTVRRIARFATSLGALLVLFLLLNNTAALVLGTPTSLRYALDRPDFYVPLSVVFPFPVPFAWLSGAAAAAWHLILVAAILVSLAVVLRQHGEDFVRKALAPFAGSPSAPLSEPNPLLITTRAFTASLFLGLLVGWLADALGQQPRVPEGIESGWDTANLILLAHASVWEEIAARVLLIGVPLLAIHFVGRGRLERPAWTYLAGGNFPVEGPAAMLLVFSSAVFGIAHVVGWDAWKLPDTVFAGLAFGYLFLRFGLVSAIVFHFLNDYILPGVALSGSSSYALLIGLIFFALAAVGIVNFIRYVFVLGEIVSARKIPAYLSGVGPGMRPAGSLSHPETAKAIGTKRPPGPAG